MARETTLTKMGRSLRVAFAVKWLRRTIKALSAAYPLSLITIALMLRYIGEAWWPTTIGLYLPRIGFALPLPLVLVALVIARQHRLLWTQAVSAFLLLVPLMGFVPPWHHRTDPSKSSVRVLSYNIDAGLGGHDKIVEEIDRYSPDIVFLQEVFENEPLAGLLRERYPSVDISEQFVTASRYPISSTFVPDKLRYEGRMRSARFRKQNIETPLGRIAFYNVHPVSAREGLQAARGNGLRHELLEGRLLRGAAAEVVQSNAGLRAEQILAIAEAARKETSPVVIAGDTNLPDLSMLFGRYLSGYRDGFKEAGWGFGYTFPAARLPGVPRLPWMRLDRILATDELRFVRFQVGQSAASDHRCVVANLQLR
jgi:endonuclease/exonuclease/phosphatase (EEP) superfamily protein YafD